MQCHFCDKSYRNDELLSNHVIACKIINNYHKKNEIVDEKQNESVSYDIKHTKLLNKFELNKNMTDDKIDKLFSLVNNLTQELHSHRNIVHSQKNEINNLTRYCVKLEDKLKTIKNSDNFNDDFEGCQRRKKKLTVFQWLMKHFSKAMDFVKWTNTIEVNYEDMINLIDSDFETGMLKILLKNLNKIKISSDIPIRAFKSRQGCIYTFSEEKQKWEFITQQQMESIGLFIQKQLFKHFKEYEKGLSDDAKYVNNHKYLIYNDRILANGILEKKVIIVKHRLYDNIKKNVKDVMSSI
jgi:hypothetical protein